MTNINWQDAEKEKPKVYYDCHHCHHRGCDICGGTGVGPHEVTDPQILKTHFAEINEPK